VVGGIIVSAFNALKVMNKKKSITCHAGARDGYYLSVALDRLGCLEKLVTDFYMPSLIGEFFKARGSSELHSSKTLSTPINFIKRRFIKNDFLSVDAALSKKAFEIANATGSNLFLTSYTAFEAFNMVKAKELDISCDLFQIHPHPLSIKKILTDELLFTPEAKFSILAEHEMNTNTEMLYRLDQESKIADRIVVASSFTKKTLTENGIHKEKITVIPYGVNSKLFPAKKTYSNKGKIKILFLGQMVQRKGLSYLLESIKQMDTSQVSLTIVGRGRMDEDLLNRYKSFVDFTILTNLNHQKLVECFHNHDVMVLPSLVEGFGHVILEAMSSGIPVICTENTAGPDVFLTGDEGFVVPIRDSDAISSSIEAMLIDKKKNEYMGRSAAKTARNFTWNQHIDSIQKFYIKGLK
jgi:glycosyltransferase involved in cell wall biosynthesis